MLRYIIQPNDTFDNVAQKFGFSNAQILSANPQVIDKDKIIAGQSLNIPGFTYIIRSGDTLNKISHQFNVPLNLLISTNPQIMYCKNIIVGQKIFITSVQTPKTPYEQALEIESNTKGIMEDIDKEDWDKANSKLTIIKNNFNELIPILKTNLISQSLINIINDAIIDLEKEITLKNVHSSKISAYTIIEYLQDILDDLRSKS